ncbi:unnamed protein product [Ambrosiozyma monospora]|uniref:Unnamed protein product n=1 Tax=Ambrosiozyma monospora TaxID=43982 RepID=A0ACB5TCV6_AMBMO|nr:unnamed protein product [Ambrosiozyma monospora]
METSNHLLDECMIIDLIWSIARRGTATRLDSKNPPIQVQEKYLTRRIIPPYHMVKVDLYIHIPIKFSLPSTALISANTVKLSSPMEYSHTHFPTCLEIQEAQGVHTNMVLAVTYKTSREYLNYQINRELLIKDEDEDEDEVVVKILNL